MTPEQNKTIYRAIKTFGERNQTMQSIEELMELQKALFENVHRGTDNRENIVEEISDVETMLAQLKIIYDIDQNELENVRTAKLNRLDHTINKYLSKHDTNTTSNIVQIDRITSNGR